MDRRATGTPSRISSHVTTSSMIGQTARLLIPVRIPRGRRAGNTSLLQRYFRASSNLVPRTYVSGCDCIGFARRGKTSRSACSFCSVDPTNHDYSFASLDLSTKRVLGRTVSCGLPTDPIFETHELVDHFLKTVYSEILMELCGQRSEGMAMRFMIACAN